MVICKINISAEMSYRTNQMLVPCCSQVRGYHVNQRDRLVWQTGWRRKTSCCHCSKQSKLTLVVIGQMLCESLSYRTVGVLRNNKREQHRNQQSWTNYRTWSISTSRWVITCEINEWQWMNKLKTSQQAIVCFSCSSFFIQQAQWPSLVLSHLYTLPTPTWFVLCLLHA